MITMFLGSPRLHFVHNALAGRVHNALAGRPRTLVALVAFLAMAMFATAGWAVWFSYELTAGLPDRARAEDAWRHGPGDDHSGRLRQTRFHDFQGTTARSSDRADVSERSIKAVVSVEDQRFYDHSGVDAIRVAAAALRNFEEGRRAEGGSTITQQLARQSFLTRDKTYRRKLQEVILAAYIEKMYGKNEILEMYLNKVYFGGGLYGVEAASRGYFGKACQNLTLDEAALLAGLIQSPSSYAPTVNLDRAVARRNVVLQAMVSPARSIRRRPNARGSCRSRS